MASGRSGGVQFGCADKVKSIPGSVGYVKYKYALKANIPQAAVLNPTGRFVKASMDTIARRAARPSRRAGITFRLL